MKSGFSRRMVLTLGTVLVLGWLGCSTVMTDVPLGKASTGIDEKELAGVWLCGDTALHLRFDGKGIGHLAWLEWDDSKHCE